MQKLFVTKTKKIGRKMPIRNGVAINLPHKHIEAFWMNHLPMDFPYFYQDAQVQPTHIKCA